MNYVPGVMSNELSTRQLATHHVYTIMSRVPRLGPNEKTVGLNGYI